ncbi:MAG TPA: PAS domain S-box protein, partial [Labilithrix sp.]|nr:PAS domain S-box protein [Labilithrix sp.]
MSVSGHSGDPALENARKSLREMDGRFKLLVDSVKDNAIFIIDKNGIVTTWNAGAERIKGYRADEIIGQHFSVFYPETDVRGGKCDLELEVATAEGRFEDEGWRVRKDGSRFWANVIITRLLDAQGSLVGFAKVTRDLTERRAAEEARVQLARTTAEREEAERALAQLARLQELDGALVVAMTPEELATIVVEKGCSALGAVAASFVRWTGTELRLTAAAGVSPAVMAAYRSFPPTLRIPPARAFLTKRAQWVESPEQVAREYPDMPSYATESAACSLPLIVADRLSGVVSFRFPEPRVFTVVERMFMETFATHVAQALERTEMHSRELAGRWRLEALSTLAGALSTALTTTDVA